MATKKSPLEFYDEELSRTIRLIQEGLAHVEWPDNSTTTMSQEEQLAQIDKLLLSCNMFLQQVELHVQQMERKSTEKAQWQEIIQFRKQTLQHVTEERANVQIFQFPSIMEDNNNNNINTENRAVSS